jgi:hypothetical protein
MSYRHTRLPIAGLVVLSLLVLMPGTGQTARRISRLEPVGATVRSSTGPTAIAPVFVLDKGRFTVFDIPFGEFGGDALSINDRGLIVGAYFDDPAATCVRGFERNNAGRFTRIDFPAAGATNLFDVNDRGQMVGNFRPFPCSDSEPLHGFLRDERGRFSAIQIPGAAMVQALGINNRGQVVGSYVDAGGTTHGYVRDGSRITAVDGPAGAAGAVVFDINDNGQMVGVYLDQAGGLHAFSLRNGGYTTIDAPGATFTFPYGVNNRGQIAGFTAATLPLGLGSDAHGFVLRAGAGGPFTPVDVPGAVGGTAAFDINGHGAVVGIYGNPDATTGRGDADVALSMATGVASQGQAGGCPVAREPLAIDS